MAQEMGFKIKVMKTLCENNIERSVDFYQFFLDRNIDAGFFISKLKCHGLNKPQSPDLVALIDRISEIHEGDYLRGISQVKIIENMLLDNMGFPIIHCGAGVNAISISPNGDVYPCVKMINEKFCNCSGLFNLIYRNLGVSLCSIIPLWPYKRSHRAVGKLE
jgi:MoaA/NifB/PqqE/SkfB family radical SAM enzyme